MNSFQVGAGPDDAAHRCNELCMEDSECLASSIWTTYDTCFLFKHKTLDYVKVIGWTTFIKTSLFKPKNEYMEFSGYRFRDHYQKFEIMSYENSNVAFKCFEYCIQDANCAGSTLLSTNTVHTCHLYNHVNAFEKAENWMSYVKKSHFKFMHVVRETTTAMHTTTVKDTTNIKYEYITNEDTTTEVGLWFLGLSNL